MKITNTSNKIISIGRNVLMPGDSMTADISYKSYPSIQAMQERGSLSLDDTEEKVAAALEERKRMEAEITAKLTAQTGKNEPEPEKKAVRRPPVKKKAADPAPEPAPKPAPAKPQIINPKPAEAEKK